MCEKIIKGQNKLTFFWGGGELSYIIIYILVENNNKINKEDKNCDCFFKYF